MGRVVNPADVVKSSSSPFSGADRGFHSLRWDHDRTLWADAKDGRSLRLTDSSRIRRLGWADQSDHPFFFRHAGPEGVAWIETADQLLVFPLDQWWPGHSVADPARMLASSGFESLFERIGKAPSAWSRLKTSPMISQPEVLLVSPQVERRRIRLAQIHVAVALSAGLSYVAVLALAITAFFNEAVRPFAWHLGAMSSVWCASTAVAATLPALAWTRRSRHLVTNPSASTTLATDKGAVMFWRTDGHLGVRDAVGVETRFRLGQPESDRQRRDALMQFGFLRDGSVALFDCTRQPRVLVRPSRRHAFDLQALSVFLESAGLSRTELTEDDLESSRELPPVGGTSDGRQAILGAGPWRTPTLVTTVPAAFIMGSIALPLAVGLVDSLDADPIWAVLAIASTALFVCTYMSIAAWALWQDRLR